MPHYACVHLLEEYQFVLNSLCLFFILFQVITNERSILIKVTNEVIIITIEFVQCCNRLSQVRLCAQGILRLKTVE